MFVTRKEYERLLRKVKSMNARLTRLENKACGTGAEPTPTVSQMTTVKEAEYGISETLNEWLNGKENTDE